VNFPKQPHESNSNERIIDIKLEKMLNVPLLVFLVEIPLDQLIGLPENSPLIQNSKDKIHLPSINERILASLNHYTDNWSFVVVQNSSQKFCSFPDIEIQQKSSKNNCNENTHQKIVRSPKLLISQNSF
jgi:hypothetical protein